MEKLVIECSGNLSRRILVNTIDFVLTHTMAEFEMDEIQKIEIEVDKITVHARMKVQSIEFHEWEQIEGNQEYNQYLQVLMQRKFVINYLPRMKVPIGVMDVDIWSEVLDFKFNSEV